VALLPVGERVIAAIFSHDAPSLRLVVQYLRALLPLIVVNGLRQYYTGMLVQDLHSRAITVLNLVYLGAMIGLLLMGRHLGWRALPTLAVAQVASAALHLALLALLYVTRYRLPRTPQHEDLTYGQVMAFFWPVATNSLMFALSRPVLYAFINRSADAVVTIAALRVAFDFAMLFQNALNQFRHLHVTFGESDPVGVRRFMARVMLAATGIMAAIAFTPLSTLIFRDLMNVDGRPLELATQALMVLCATPLVITIRNYFHGQLLCRRRTRGMAVGGIFRVVAIYAASWLLYRMGYLNHVTAGVALQLGFLAEAVCCAPFLLYASAPKDRLPLEEGEP
jgi:hypothetical protein